MQNVFLIITLLFVPFFLQADNWDLFPFNQKTYYYFQTGEGETISTYFMDYEEEIEEGVLQFPLRTYIETLLPICYPPPLGEFGGGDYSTSLLADVFLKQANNQNNNYTYIHNYFKNPHDNNDPIKDTIPFRQHTAIGESWEIHAKVYNTPNFSYSHLKITCVSIDFEEIVSGTVDSTKTFQIQAFEGENPIESKFDDITIKLSKHFGLIEWIPFHGFFGYYYSGLIQLAGFEDAEGNVKGEHPPLVTDFFPYEVGDFLKWKYVNQFESDLYEIYEDEIIEVTEIDNTMAYLFNRVTHEFVIDEMGNSESTVIEEDSLLRGHYIPQDFIDYAYWDLGITLHDYSQNGEYSSFEADYHGLRLKKVEPIHLGNCTSSYELILMNAPCFFYGNSGPNPEDNYCDFHCVGQDYPFTNYKDTHYSAHLGMTSSSSNGYSWPATQTSLSLIEASIGECYFTNIESPTYFALQITLHPNPTHNRFILQLQNPKQQTQNLQLTITDIHGRTLQQLPLLQASIEVDLSEQPNGIYLVQISDGKNWWTEKVVKY